MRLHERGRVLLPERAGRLELGRRRGDGKARRDDVGEPVDAVPALDQGFGLRRSRLARCLCRSSGALRSIITLPAAMQKPRACAAAKKASTDAGCTVQ